LRELPIAVDDALVDKGASRTPSSRFWSMRREKYVNVLFANLGSRS
jgi:hypothetical protein